jgi:hypothetical protein
MPCARNDAMNVADVLLSERAGEVDGIGQDEIG